MAATDPVQIVVEIVNQTKDDIARIKKDLEEIGLRDVNVDLEIDSSAEIAKTKAEIEALDGSEINLDIEARKAIHDITGRGIAESVDEWIPFDEGMRPMGPFIGGGRDLDTPDVDMRDLPNERLNQFLRENSRGFKRLGQTLLEYRPSIMDWWNVLALLIPIMISLAGAAIGVAAAFGALGAGAAGIIGLGLVGWGEDMQSAMQNFRKELVRVGRQLFQVAKPLGDLFRPIVERWLGGMANQARRLVDPLSRLTVFADGLAAAGSGVVGWLIEAINAMANMNEIAEQVALRMGEAFGQFVIDALSNMLREVHRNQDAYINMAELLLDVIVIIFNLSKTVTFVVSAFEPLFAIIAGITNFLANKFVVTVLTTLATILALEGTLALAAIAFTKLQAASMAAAASWVTNLIPSLTKAMGHLAAFIGLTESATFSWLRLAAVTGAGLLIAGGGILAAEAVSDSMTPPSGAGQRQIGGTTVINVEGDMRKREVDRIVDEMGPQTRRENSINRSMTDNG